MDDSILGTIKKMLGLDENYTAFDTDVIVNINSSIAIANQLGVGTDGFIVTGSTETWRDLVNDRADLNLVQMFIYYHTKLGFDPPSNSFLVNSIESKLDEIAWRLNVQAEKGADVE